jgi:hypothetical protein
LGEYRKVNRELLCNLSLAVSVHFKIIEALSAVVLFFMILWFELRVFTLSHSTTPVFVMGFFEVRSGELFT